MKKRDTAKISTGNVVQDTYQVDLMLKGCLLGGWLDVLLSSAQVCLHPPPYLMTSCMLMLQITLARSMETESLRRHS